MLASSSTTRTRCRRASPAARCRRRPARSRPLAVEPGVDVALAEPPLPADAHGGNLPGLDQAVDRTEVDLEVFEDLFRGEEDFVVSEGDWSVTQ